MNTKCQPFGEGKEASMAAFPLEKSHCIHSRWWEEDKIVVDANNDKLHQINMSTVIYVCMYVIYDSW